MRTLYLWDLAGTLFLEKWNSALTGYKDFESYVVGLGKDPDNPREFEESFREPYIQGEMFNLRLAPGFKKVLEWTKNNETFSTGIKEQMSWRAHYLNPKVGFDVQSFFQDINSTFDYGETNVKTIEMMVSYLRVKVEAGYDCVVYTDDKLVNCQFFKNAAEEVKKISPNFNYRIYRVANDNQGPRQRGWYCDLGTLLDILDEEKLYA